MRSVRMPPSSTPVTASGLRSAYAGSEKRSATWTTSLVLTMRPKADVGRCRGTRRRCSRSGVGVLCAAAIRNTSPSRRYMFPNVASQMRTAFASMVSKTGSNSPDDVEMTCSTSEVAVCCSSASASSRLYASSCCSSSARGSRTRPPRALAFVPVEGSLRPRVGIFAPLRDKVTSSAQSLGLPILTHDELASSLDHLVGAGEQSGRDGEAERLCGREIDDEFHLGGKLDRQIG